MLRKLRNTDSSTAGRWRQEKKTTRKKKPQTLFGLSKGGESSSASIIVSICSHTSALLWNKSLKAYRMRLIKSSLNSIANNTGCLPGAWFYHLLMHFKQAEYSPNYSVVSWWYLVSFKDTTCTVTLEHGYSQFMMLMASKRCQIHQMRVQYSITNTTNKWLIQHMRAHTVASKQINKSTTGKFMFGCGERYIQKPI